MTTEQIKDRTKIELTKMGYGKESESLIKKYWSMCEYIKTARGKALFMTA